MQHFALERLNGIPTPLPPDAEFIAGGTDMLQLLREDVRHARVLVDVLGALPDDIAFGADLIRIGAGVTLEEVARNEDVARVVPAVTQALNETASPQVRNLATIGGNLLQRTRCGYYRDAGQPHCNKRVPGSGCAATGGENRILAVLGTSEHCIATHASDLAVALTALRAFVLVRGPRGERRIDMDALHRLPGDRPDQETTLLPDELIEAVEIPIDVAARNSVYLKVRDRASFEWALVSAAVGLEIENGRIREARIAMGGVGTKPWRMPVVEQTLVGHAPDRKDIAAAVRRCTEGGRGWGRNDFKLDLMPRVLARAIELAGDAA